ncbi:HAMP domain-containing histidine kinase (plasmid) [Halarchaeum sp. CBA1220]|uniref:sensor histidine kinase n=1 Tax=Halarchaeum sp. CBA1220 TaxID=1853682 RepID=UPI000F3AA888|nr:HAMP domain-containing sensor histidine kinase [Halarchaeum sp. CBA1220]QLC34711.1 HAMP domain-containing histidine kinase [Halarchaeum sp. CBA1220]
MGVEHTVPGASDVLERTRDAVLVYDTDGDVSDANAAAHDELPDALLDDAFDDADGGTRAYRDALTAVRVGQRDDARARLSLADRTLDARFTPVDDDPPRPVCAVLREQDDPRVEDLALLCRVLRHDIRNRATIIGGWADHLRENADPDERPTYDRITDAVDDIIRTIETADGMADAVVRGQVVTEPVPLAETLEREAEAVRREHPDAVVSGPDLDADIAVEATPMLGTVFYNLLQNAVVHNPASEPHVTVSVDRTPDTVTVSVADDGPGIPPDCAETLFERGEQGAESRGNGLGLYLVKKFVDAFGGDITAGANDPTGAVFAVTLRRA